MPKPELPPAEYVTRDSVFVLDPHQLRDKHGKVIVDVTEDMLNKIAQNQNARIKKTGDATPLVIGHTKDDGHEHEQPELVGYATDWRLEKFFKTGKRALACTFHVFSKAVDKVRKYPRRSVELWLDSLTIDPISLLGATTPERDLGLLKLSKDNTRSKLVATRDDTGELTVDPQTQQLAADFLYAIKQRLTHPMYADLQSAYAAGVGFNSKTASWQATRVTFGDELRESSEKDPNIEAVGIGGQIYGKRADMIIVDDAVTLKNANEFEKQIRWLTQDVRSRLNPTGKLIIIGTRVASVDLYRELRSEDRYPGGLVPWKYLAMPALLDADEDPDKWVTLWPASDAPFDGQAESDKNDDGLYPRWSGRNLYNERQAMDASTWALVYQQQDVSENAAFDPVCVKGSIDGMRKAGNLVAGHPGHPRDLNGFTYICGLDPAMIGDTAAICYAIDRSTRLSATTIRHHILDCR